MNNEIIRKFIIEGEQGVYTITPLRGAVKIVCKYPDGYGGEEGQYLYIDQDVLSNLRKVLDEVEKLL